MSNTGVREVPGDRDADRGPREIRLLVGCAALHLGLDADGLGLLLLFVGLDLLVRDFPLRQDFHDLFGEDDVLDEDAARGDVVDF